MEALKAFQLITISVSLAVISLVLSVNGQIRTPCTTSMMSSFSPCLSFITGSSRNGSSPTQACCSSLKSILGTGMDCACLLITANVPVQLPINRTLAISLPRACNIRGVPTQCKATGSPFAAPGPGILGPTPSPSADSPTLTPRGPTPSPSADSPTLSPRASKAVAAAPTPHSETPDAASPSVESEAPTDQTPAGTGRPQLTPSASTLSHVSPPSILLIILGIMAYKSSY